MSTHDQHIFNAHVKYNQLKNVCNNFMESCELDLRLRPTSVIHLTDIPLSEYLKLNGHRVRGGKIC